ANRPSLRAVESSTQDYGPRPWRPDFSPFLFRRLLLFFPCLPGICLAFQRYLAPCRIAPDDADLLLFVLVTNVRNPADALRRACGSSSSHCRAAGRPRRPDRRTPRSRVPNERYRHALDPRRVLARAWHAFLHAPFPADRGG